MTLAAAQERQTGDGTRGNDSEPFDLSAVIPVLNEQDGLDACHRELSRVLSETPWRYQLIFVDDGSTDASWQRLEALQANSAHTLCIKLRRHVGQPQALLVGLRFAAGKAIITYDADMQFAPECVPRLAAKIYEGYNIAGGIRTVRRPADWVSRLPSILGRYLINHALQINQQDFGAVKAYSRRMVDEILSKSNERTVIPALAYMLSRNFIEIPVDWRPRTTGRSKWNVIKRAETFLQISASHAPRPLRWLSNLARTKDTYGGAAAWRLEEVIECTHGAPQLAHPASADDTAAS